MIERVHNMRASVVRKRLSNDEAGGSPCKKGRPKRSVLLNRYPSLNTDLDFSDAASDERNRKALECELEREPPRKEYVRSLLRPRGEEISCQIPKMSPCQYSLLILPSVFGML